MVAPASAGLVVGDEVVFTEHCNAYNMGTLGVAPGVTAIVLGPPREQSGALMVNVQVQWSGSTISSRNKSITCDVRGLELPPTGRRHRFVMEGAGSVRANGGYSFDDTDDSKGPRYRKRGRGGGSGGSVPSFAENGICHVRGQWQLIVDGAVLYTNHRAATSKRVPSHGWRVCGGVAPAPTMAAATATAAGGADAELAGNNGRPDMLRFSFTQIRQRQAANFVVLSGLTLYAADGAELPVASIALSNGGRPASAASDPTRLLAGPTAAAAAGGGHAHPAGDWKVNQFNLRKVGVVVELAADAPPPAAYQLFTAAESASDANDPISWFVEARVAGQWHTVDQKLSVVPPSSNGTAYRATPFDIGVGGPTLSAPQCPCHWLLAWSPSLPS
jgi:hypothetical protein